MQTDTMKIMEYGLMDFCRSVQKAINEGYEFDFSTNEGCPAAYGTHMECLMVKRKVEPKVEVTETVEPVAEPEVQPEVKATVEPEVEEAKPVLESAIVNTRRVGRPAKV